MSEATQDKYYVPEAAKWPIVGSISLTMLLGGFAAYLNGSLQGPTFMVVGFILFIVMLFGWFGTVVNESETGVYRGWEDTSFRMGMMWFIFSEVMFFAAFFGALFYMRVLSVPW